jgi:hypothetical protein
VGGVTSLRTVLWFKCICTDHGHLQQQCHAQPIIYAEKIYLQSTVPLKALYYCWETLSIGFIETCLIHNIMPSREKGKIANTFQEMKKKTGNR